MSKKFKAMSLIIAGLMGVTLLSGCGSIGGNSSNGNSNDEIIVWSYLMDNEVEEVNKIAQEWGKENNKKVTVVKDNSDFQNFLQAANSSKGPDVVFGIAHNNLGTFHEAGLLEEIPDGFVNKDGYVNSTVWDAVSYDNKPFAVPISMETYALFYNKDKVKQMPENIEKLVEEAKAYGPSGFQFSMNEFYYTAAFVQSYGGYVFGNKNGTTDINDIGLGNEGSIKAYKFLQDLVQKDKLMPADITTDIANSNFKTGNAIYYIGGPWDVSGFKDAGVNFGVAPIPKINNSDAKTFMGVQSAFVSSNSNKKDDSWNLLKYLVENSPEKLYEIGNRLPVIKSKLEVDEIKNNEYSQAFIKQAQSSVPMPNVPEIECIWEPLKNITRIFNGEDPATVAKDIEQGVKDGIEMSK
ncbi:sugar ABC transporter substrate-binding protein [Clostridium butyricum]|uniref:sugar ABC transporter substrate-binding protein n=1 Tax=Clostridium butyricum TaxID=1492 RepID=UPI003F8E325E